MMLITPEKKQEMFQMLLELENKSEIETFDNRNYLSESTGAFLMLQILGLEKEYINWAVGK